MCGVEPTQNDLGRERENHSTVAARTSPLTDDVLCETK